MKPNFESPVHTARDLVERDITLYHIPGAQVWRQMLSQSDIPEYRKIAETMIITKSWEQVFKMTKNELLSQGTHALMVSYLSSSTLAWATEFDHDKGKYKRNSGRGYYRGEMLVLTGVIPETGYLTHKKWHLNEVDRKKFIYQYLFNKNLDDKQFTIFISNSAFIFNVLLFFRNWPTILFASSR